MVLFICILVFDVKAQGVAHLNPAHATTYEWSALARLQILDETHAYNEIFYDRGFNRVLTPLVKREYELDTWTQDHQFNEAYAWYQNPLGFRTRIGSYSKTSLALLSQLHTTVSVGSKSELLIDFYAHQHARATRALVEFGYQHTFNQHKFSVQHTLTEFKEDLDMTLAYETSNDVWGAFKFDFTLMNYLNNAVKKLGNEDPKPEETRLLQSSIKTFPAFFSGRYRTPAGRFYHADFSFGWQPKRIDVFTDKTQPAFSYEQERFISFVNASVDISTHYSTLGVFFYEDNDHLKRASSGDPFEGAYRAAQRSRRMGGFWYGYFNHFRPFLRISREKYSDQQSGDDFSISIISQALDYNESRWILDAGLNIQPFKVPFFVELRYMSLNRDELDTPASELITSEWTNQYYYVAPHNNRVVCSFNFIASDKFHLEVGAAYDIDGDLHEFNNVVKRFDKGFAKLIAWF